jgi:hypothetical protein
MRRKLTATLLGRGWGEAKVEVVSGADGAYFRGICSTGVQLQR